ncbi:uncharacterized mitochondrial protein AtMg00860-like [Benincasa hispida]|uniref:uncharacterized mitochondrial protein AtMg00860-like n=1 Tax=Benincasa hispida TaxID=102211 RepID=UPI001902100F|nr:uncharacterized mitochondrial protein AtMg00860-like [Benincasa hispida]
MAIFSDFLEKIVEVFMDDFSVFGDSFQSCLDNLDVVLACYEETNLVLNWEKCHFMVTEGIILGHKISKAGLEVDGAKIDVIVKLPPSANVKTLRSFLGHVNFYRQFVKGFSQIARPLNALLEANWPYVFNEDCTDAFETLKYALTTAPVLIAPDWMQHFISSPMRPRP